MEEILDDNIAKNDKTEYAGFWIRFGASLLDFLILSPLLALIFYNNFSMKSFVLMLVLSIVIQLYKPIMEGMYGYTLGKKILDLRIVDEHHEKINMKHALTRWILWAVSGIISLIASINLFNNEAFQDATGLMEISLLQKEDFFTTINNFYSIVFLVIAIMVGIDKRKQGLHDKMAETFVIKKTA